VKKKYIVSAIAALVLVGGIVTYTALGDYMGNNIEVESVMDRTESAATAGEENSEATSTAPVSAEEVNGNWEIASGSKVYWSVTTSKETVNFVNEGVTGTWTVDVNDPEATSGEGIVDMNVLDSGNSQRDSHVKERADLLEVAEFPEATFVTSSFSELPTEWTNGTTVPVTIEGTLTVKGIEKDVVFESEVMYQDGQLLLSGETVVTFADFGMQSPHAIVLEAENDLTVQLELVLVKV
jgi:polyisoprenoid-binding protein YceI